MKSVIPHFMVRDMDRTLAFYREALGFSVAFTMPDDKGGLAHASMQRGDVSIMFGPFHDEPADGNGRGVMLYFSVNDDEEIDALFAQARQAGAQVLQEPTEQFWGDRDWGVSDPDGYRIWVSKTVKAFDPAAFAGQNQLVASV